MRLAAEGFLGLWKLESVVEAVVHVCQASQAVDEPSGGRIKCGGPGL